MCRCPEVAGSRESGCGSATAISLKRGFSPQRTQRTQRKDRSQSHLCGINILSHLRGAPQKPTPFWDDLGCGGIPREGGGGADCQNCQNRRNCRREGVEKGLCYESCLVLCNGTGFPTQLCGELAGLPALGCRNCCAFFFQSQEFKMDAGLVPAQRAADFCGSFTAAIF